MPKKKTGTGKPYRQKPPVKTGRLRKAIETSATAIESKLRKAIVESVRDKRLVVSEPAPEFDREFEIERARERADTVRKRWLERRRADPDAVDALSYAVEPQPIDTAKIRERAELRRKSGKASATKRYKPKPPPFKPRSAIEAKRLGDYGPSFLTPELVRARARFDEEMRKSVEAVEKRRKSPRVDLSKVTIDDQVKKLAKVATELAQATGVSTEQAAEMLRKLASVDALAERLEGKGIVSKSAPRDARSLRKRLDALDDEKRGTKTKGGRKFYFEKEKQDAE